MVSMARPGYLLAAQVVGAGGGRMALALGVGGFLLLGGGVLGWAGWQCTRKLKLQQRAHLGGQRSRRPCLRRSTTGLPPCGQPPP